MAKSTPLQDAFGPAKFLSVAANQTLYVNADAITKVKPTIFNNGILEHEFPKDMFRHTVGTWYHVTKDTNVSPFSENVEYFFFNDSHKFGDLYPASGTSPLGYKFEVRRPEGWIKTNTKWGIPQGFHMSQGPHDPQLTGKVSQYEKLEDCQVVANFWTWVSWSKIPKSGDGI